MTFPMVYSEVMETTQQTPVKFGKITRRTSGEYVSSLTAVLNGDEVTGTIVFERGDEWNTYDTSDRGWWRVIITENGRRDEAGEFMYRTKRDAVHAYYGGLVYDAEWGFVGA